MGRSWQLGSIAGIRLQVHWTFLLIVAWVTLTSVLAGMNLLGVLYSICFILTLFGCVLLHELGHALAARRYGIATRDITLLPIGGVARLERMPRNPVQELVVALAGPAVNVLIAGLLLAVLLPSVGAGQLAAVPLRSGGFLQQLLAVNVVLILFNMLPAFPLDGGRVFRALLALVFNYSTATRIAAFIGQLCAVGLGLLAIFNPFLLLIAVFIFFGAAAEARQVSVREKFRDYQVRDGMLRTFQVIPASASVQRIGPQLLDHHQRDFPVVDGEKFVGMLRRDTLLEFVGRDEDVLVSEIMQDDVRAVEESDSLMAALEKASPSGGDTLPVTSGGLLTGLLDLQQVFDLANVRVKLRKAASYVQSLPPQGVLRG